MDVQFGIHLMLYLAAALQVVAAGLALLMIPLSGRRASWIVMCMALVLQAWRRVYYASAGGDLHEAITALLVSVLLLGGIIGVRAVFVALRRTSRQLREERERGGTFLNRVGAAIVILDTEGIILQANPATCALIGCSESEALGRNWFEDFVDLVARDEVHSSFSRLLQSPDGNDEYVEYDLTDVEGCRHTVVWHRRILRDEAGNPRGVRSAGIDLTERSQLQEELTFRSLLLDQTTDAVLVYRPDGTIVYANDTACMHRECLREDLLGRNVRQFIPRADLDSFEVHLQTVRQGSYATFETEFVTGRLVRPLESHMSPMSVGGHDYIVDVARDISERRAAEAAVRRLAYSDQLTGLPNRTLLHDRGQQAIARARRLGERFAVLFVDVDDLKTVNDTFGHSAGDELLRLAADRLSTLFRGEDTVSRIGGDEFVVLARVEDLAAADELVERVRTALREPFDLFGEEVSSSASVGMAMYPGDGDDLDVLMATADADMYASKVGPGVRSRIADGPEVKRNGATG
ncbi:MAG: diguanylate cyclase domain-containing protein [Coriobacteriia bacterium]